MEEKENVRGDESCANDVANCHEKESAMRLGRAALYRLRGFFTPRVAIDVAFMVELLSPNESSRMNRRPED